MKSTERRPSASELERLAPSSVSQHEPIPEALYEKFSEILDLELAAFEDRFRHLQTPKSLRHSLSR
ncbi:MAG: hypothetical protein RIS70_788 [Planctomycetota bacterium]|jgi:hypothetical protein